MLLVALALQPIAMTAATFGLIMHSLISSNYYWLNWSMNMWQTMFLLVTISTTIPLFMVAEGINKAGAFYFFHWDNRWSTFYYYNCLACIGRNNDNRSNIWVLINFNWCAIPTKEKLKKIISSKC